MNDIITKEQKGYKKVSREFKEQRKNRIMYACHIDYRKAFGSLPHSWLIVRATDPCLIQDVPGSTTYCAYEIHTQKVVPKKVYDSEVNLSHMRRPSVLREIRPTVDFQLI